MSEIVVSHDRPTHSKAQEEFETTTMKVGVAGHSSYLKRTAMKSPGLSGGPLRQSVSYQVVMVGLRCWVWCGRVGAWCVQGDVDLCLFACIFAGLR